ncbi:phage portal protein [Luteimonas aquatica]|uniref:phage portal protein n=1 Tax=Luteimonas aquatica TaxID=450364 RepID=UPI001F5A24F5|nr:phage portal protein [Luteimonas aquatica]
MKLWPFRKAEKRDVDPSWSALLNQGAVSASGAYVDAKAAEGIAAVFGCVQALSESTACLPLHVYQRNDDGERERADDHPLARTLRTPNPHQSGLAFREAMTASVLLHGNAFARKEYNDAGELVGLHPIATRGVTVLRLPSGRYAYDYTDDAGQRQRLLEDEVFHLADRAECGSIVGKSRIAIARDTLGMGLSLREHGASTFRNGARLSGVLKTPNVLNDDTAGRISTSWQSQFGGSGNAGKTAILENGLEYQQVSMSLEDAQWIAAQQFTTEEVCRIFRVPPTMIGDLRFGSYQNTAELGSQFVRYSLARWIALWESEISRQLLTSMGRRRYLAEHSVEGLLRGNPEARADFYQKAITAGWMTTDEVRRLENLPKRTEPRASTKDEGQGDE